MGGPSPTLTAVLEDNMAKLTLSYSDVWQKVAEFLGLVASGTAPTGQDLTDVKDITARGLRQFLYSVDARDGLPHEWSFLQQYWTVSLLPNKWKYAIPTDFSDMLTDLVFDTNLGFNPLKRRHAHQIKDMRSYTDKASYPEFFAITPSKYDADIGSAYELWVYPKPSQAYTVSCFYRIDPLEPSADADLLVGGVSATEAILESCLAVAEHWSDEMVTSHHNQKAQELIQILIRFDADKVESDVLGNLYWHERYLWPRERPLLTRVSTANIYTDT